MRAFSFAPWRRAVFWEAWRVPRAMSRWFWTRRASNIVLVETVGVGQDEVDIVRLADCTLVLLVPGLGDDVQNMKAGLMEIADIFVLNKSDREGADRLEAELEAMLQLAPERDGWKPRIVRTVATENKGVDEVAAAIAQYREHFGKARSARTKKIEHWKRRLLALAGELFLERAISGAEGEAALDALAREVAEPEKGSLRGRSRIAVARGAFAEEADETGRPRILASYRRNVPPRRRSDVRRDTDADVGARCAARRPQSNPHGHEFAADPRGGKMDSCRNRRGR